MKGGGETPALFFCLNIVKLAQQYVMELHHAALDLWQSG